jgi:hypothetical protein
MPDRMNSLNSGKAVQVMETCTRRAFTLLQERWTAEDFQFSAGAARSLPGTCYSILLERSAREIPA